MSDQETDVQTELPETVVDNEDVALEVLEEELEATGNEDEVTKDATKYRAKIDGEEREVTLDELIAGYQKATAADKRFEEAASYRKEAEAKIQQTETELRSRYEARINEFVPEQERVIGQLQQYVEYLSNPQPGETTEDMVVRLSEKERYLNEYRKAVSTYRQARSEQDRIQQENDTKHQQMAQERLAAAEKALVEAIPEWKDDKKRNEEGTKIVAWMKNQGLTDQDIAVIHQGAFGHYPVVMARKAMLYDAFIQKVAARKTGQSEMTSAPAPVTNIRSSSGASKDPDKMSTKEWMAWRDKQMRKS